MMRAFAIAAVCALAAACQPEAAAPTAQLDACQASAERTFDFVETGSQESLRAVALGPDCSRVAVTLTLRGADGAPLYAFAALGEDVLGPVPHEDEDAEHDDAPHDALTAALDAWIGAARPSTTAAAPDWADGAPGPGGGADGSSSPYATAFARETYLDIRARGLPMLCYTAEASVGHCVYWEPAAARALLLTTFAG
jgi:hypothetical protein